MGTYFIVRVITGFGNVIITADLSSGDYELVCQCDASRSDPVL